MRAAFLVGGLLAASMFLAACGGGGGGGGGGGSSSRPVLTPSQQAQIEAVFPMGTLEMADLNPATAQSEGLHISKTADGIRIQKTTSPYFPGINDDRTINFSALNGDFIADGGFLKASKQTRGNITGNYPGTFVASDSVWLGGKTGGLEHSDFGAWRHTTQYALTGSDLDGASGFAPFFMGAPSKKAHFDTPQGEVTFSGATMAAFNSQKEMAGTVDLRINTNSLNSSMAVIKLTDFYDFSVPIAVGAGGDIKKRAGSIGYDRNGSTPLPPYETVYGVPAGSLDGQFYGDAPGNPTEAVGSYQINLTVKDSFGAQMPATILGSFGAKK